jgi:prepilin-type N-terminal cleavage/methylation domain-containing protein
MRPINTSAARRLSRHRAAFTLIELLTVIVIIGILASLTVGVAGIASRRSKVSRTQAELARLDLAIREYKARFGFYPPDNVINPSALTQDPVVNQLYYELSGAVISGGQYQALPDAPNEVISRAGYVAGFGSGNLSGIYNSSGSAANVKSFLTGGRAAQVRYVALTSYPPVGGAFGYKALVVPVEWPLGHWKTQLPPGDPNYDARLFPPLSGYTADPATLRVNPWRYNVTNPTNNPGEFDLWADIVVGNDFITIGNWKDE